MKLILTDATSFEVDSISSGDVDVIDRNTNKTTSEDTINIYFTIGADDNPLELKNKIKAALTEVNIAGAYIIRDDEKRVNLNCKSLYNIVFRLTDLEYSLSAVLLL